MAIPIQQTVRRMWSRVRRRPRSGERRLGAPALVMAGIAGAVAGYFLGRHRRGVAKDRIATVLGRGEEAAGDQDQAEGLNDPALEAKVESEIFRDADAPKDKVSVSVEDGVVYLRGELPTKKAGEELARSARSVEGVVKVVNLLHRPGEEAPSKQDGDGRGDAKRPSGKTRGKAKRQAPARSK